MAKKLPKIFQPQEDKFKPKPEFKSVPEARTPEQDIELQKKTLMAPRNVGIETATGRETPVIQMQGPREQVFQKQFAQSNLPALAALESKQKLQKQIAGAQQVPALEFLPAQELPFRQEEGMPEQPKENIVAAASRATLTFASRGIDALRTLWTGKKSTPVQQAEQTFADASSVIKQNIEMIKSGGDYTEAAKDFERAIGAIQRLEGETKLKGQLNARYWIDGGGKELEASIAYEKTSLERLRAEMNFAIRQQITTRLNMGVAQ